MRRSPSIVPGSEPAVYMVIDNLGKLGSARLTRTQRITKLSSGIFLAANSNPVRVVSFNTTEGWSRDVSAEIAEDLQQRCDLEDKELPESL